MGELVQFRPIPARRRAAGSRRLTAGASSGAEILFFTGVQIIREEAVEPSPEPNCHRAPARRNSSRKRRERQPDTIDHLLSSGFDI